MSVRSTSSSPDPLSRSIDRLYPPSSPTKRTRITTPKSKSQHIVTSSAVLSRGSSPAKSRSSSPRKHDQPISLEPGHSVVLTTPARTSRDGVSNTRSSPLKIRLTVETDQDEAGNDYELFERTTTITVPLKGEDEHKPVKRRIRRRKSGITSSAERPKIGDNPVGGTSPGKALRLPTTDVVSAVNNASAALIHATAEVATKPTGHGRVTRMNFANLTPLHLKKNALIVSDELETPYTPWEVKKVRGTKAAQKIRDRVPTPRKPTGWDTSGMSTDITSSPAKQDGQYSRSEEGGDHSVFNSNILITSDVVENEDEDCVNEEQDMLVSGVDEDTTMLDRSAVESEGFSMVSIDSLRNRQELLDQRRTTVVESGNTRDASWSSIRPRHSQTNPVHPRSPPSSSPTTRPLELDRREGSPLCTLAKVSTTESTTMSQSTNVITRHSANSNNHENVSILPQKTAKLDRKRKSDEGVFDAFGSGTKRHLRAGLAMEELLVRNERGFAQSATKLKENHDDSEHLRATVPGHTATRTAPRLPTPAASVDSNHAASTATERDRNPSPNRTGQNKQISQSTFSSSPPSVGAPYNKGWQSNDDKHEAEATELTELDHTQAMQQELQREREEVIRQIQDANTSQVIMIDSDDVVENENDDEDEPEEHSPLFENIPDAGAEPTVDIWGDEADRSLENAASPSLPITRNQTTETADSPPPNFADLFVPDLKPPRSKLPRTWRRVSGAGFHYSDEAESPVRPVTHIVACNTSVLRTTASEEPAQLSQVVLTEQTPALKNNLLAISRSLGQNDYSTQAVHFKGATSNLSLVVDDIDNREVYEGSNAAPDAEYSVDDKDLDATFLEDYTNLHQVSTLDGVETSDVRQITRETEASTKPPARTVRIFPKQSHLSNTNESSAKLQPIPGRKYAALFEENRNDPRLCQTSAPKPAKSHPTVLATTHQTNNGSLSAAEHPAPSANIISRMVSWLWPISSTDGSPTDIAKAPTTKSQLRQWTRNHYLLLDHYYMLSYHVSTANRPRLRGPQLPSTYFVKRSELPVALMKYIDLPLTTRHPSLHPRGTVSEHWIRVAYAFMSVAKEQGIPLLCNGSFEQEPQQTRHAVSVPALKQNRTKLDTKVAEKEYPKRGPDGHVLRIKEDWCGNGGEWEVLTRIYSLWVRDVLAGKIAQGDVVKFNPALHTHHRVENMEAENEVDELLVREAGRRTEEWVRTRSRMK